VRLRPLLPGGRGRRGRGPHRRLRLGLLALTIARSAYRYLTALFVVDIALQLTLAAYGAFHAHAGEAARDQPAFDPHRLNGDIAILIALLVLVAAIVAKNGRWRIVLPVFVLMLVQSVLAHAGTIGGVLHGLVAFLIVGAALELARGAWARQPV
jgi:hypothetical protein